MTIYYNKYIGVKDKWITIIIEREMEKMIVVIIILSVFIVALLIGISIVIKQKKDKEIENNVLRYDKEKGENAYAELMNERRLLSAQNDENNTKINELMGQKHEFEMKLRELQDSVEGSALVEQWKKELDDVSQKLKEERQNLGA